MDNNMFPSIFWARILIGRQLQIIDTDNVAPKYFFGKQLIVGKTISEIVESVDCEQANVITNGLTLAFNEKRDTYFIYLSSDSNGAQIHVSVNVQYCNEGQLCMYITELNVGDLETASKTVLDPNVNTMLNVLYENLPIGIDLCDKNGILIDINSRGLRDVGVTDKKELLGLCLFDHPLLPDGVKEKLKAGENVKFFIDYDFDKLNGFYKTSLKGQYYYEMVVSVIRDKKGDVDKYILIAKEVTDYIKLKNKYQDLYSQNETVIDSIPIGIGIYDIDGTMRYVNEANCRAFGVDRQQSMSSHDNIFNAPFLSQDMQDCIKTGDNIDIQFEYQLPKIQTQEEEPAQIRHLELKGRPIMCSDDAHNGYVFIVEDITEKVTNYALLRQSRQKAEMAMQAADIMLWEFDVVEELFYSDNDPITDFNNSQPIGVDLYISSVHPDERELASHLVDQLIAGEDFSFSHDFRVLFPDRPGWNYCTITGSPYQKDKNGKVIKYIGVRKDNTKLQKQKILQEKILNSIPMSILIKDIEDDFHYVFCNDESHKLLGNNTETAIDKLVDEADIARIYKTDMEVFKSGEPYIAAERVNLRNGRSYDTIVRKSVIEDSNGKRLLLSIRWDQSLHNDLQRRSKLFGMTLESMDAFTWLYEPDKQQINFGDGLAKLGNRVSEIDTLEKYIAFMHKDDVKHFVESLQAVLERGSGVWKAEHRLDINGNGCYRWLEARGILETTTLNDAPYKYVIGMTISIDEYKRTEQILIENKESLNQLIRQNELIMNNTNSGLVFITKDYMVQWENVSICSTSISYEAYKRGEYCYKSAYNRTSPCDDCVMQRAMVSRQMEQRQFVLQNNRIIEVFATPVFKDEVVEGIVIRIDDITERQKIIEELRQAKALAEQADKLKSAFLANMSHEIRTPLNAIIGFSDLLISDCEDESRDEYINIIRNNNELLLKLIGDILDLSKIEAGSIDFKYEEFDLSQYFNEMSASMRQRITNPKVKLVEVNPYPSCIVTLDRIRVAQLVTNYVTNAIKYTPEGSIEMGYRCVDGGVRLYVKDSGIGISEEKLSRVFQRFAKLDEFAQGTGLGLSICKAIAESMGGSVGFDSKYGEGSLFWAFLPCLPILNTINQVEDGELEVEQESILPSNSNNGLEDKQTIVIAEDLNNNYIILTSILKDNFIILRAKNGAEAVEFVRNNEVDLVFMDMKMPVMDGLTATAKIREFNAELPIIALTAHAFESDRVASMNAGCSEYLVKPIDKSRLIPVLQKYCSVTIE